MKKYICLLGFILISACTLGQNIPRGYKLVYNQNFSSPRAITDFEFTQPSKWLISKDGKREMSLEFTGISDFYIPPFRSPHTIGLIKDLQVANFILEADLLQTGKEYGHRDMVIVFGFQNAAQFYYSHIASKTDDNAHQVMLVNTAPRTKISSFTTEGVEWGDKQWHKVRIERSVDAGSIKIYFDGKLIQEANDRTFSMGAIGFGSFDDSGKIDNIKIWADNSKKVSAVYFPKGH